MSGARLLTPAAAPAAFEVLIEEGRPLRFEVTEGGATRDYELGQGRHVDLIDAYAALSADFGLRLPLARQSPPTGANNPTVRPVLTKPVSDRILYGYGDPCVVQVGPRDYRLLVTSNDAADAFPILTSSDLENWRLTGFVFPTGQGPAWALQGPDISDFWAPELHRVGDEWWVCFTARTQDRSLAIGLARSRSPDGPFVADPTPLVGGGVIDAHILVDAEGAPWLIWKQDDNDRWPRALMTLMAQEPRLVSELFAGIDARTAAFVLTLWPWARSLDPMRQFSVLQPVVEIVGENVGAFETRLAAAIAERLHLAVLGAEIASALRTRIFAQRLSLDGRALEGSSAVILENDRPWEGHLIEGVWITRESGRYHLVYAGNDFSTARYGIGAAVSDRPNGPYRKHAEVFLRSTESWWGPGHPSIVRAPDGRWRMFLHAFPSGNVGYKAFRALLTTSVDFESGAISLALSKSAY